MLKSVKQATFHKKVRYIYNKYKPQNTTIMAFPLIPVLIGLAAAGTAASAAVSRKNTKDQLKASRHEAERERASNLEMWNMQNAYNSPKEQMARLQSAGLNPNLAYGSGNVAGMSSDAPKGYQRANLPDFSKRQSVLGATLQAAPQLLSMYQDYKMKNAQIGIAQSEQYWRNPMLNEKQLLIEAQRGLTAGRSAEVHARLPYAGELAKTSLEAQKANVERTKAITTGLRLENQISKMLKPYGLTAKDNAAIRQIVRVMSEDNPNISAIDVMLLLPTLLPGLGLAGKSLKPLTKIK